MEEHVESSFGSVLRFFRRRINMTQENLAKKLKVHVNSVGLWERDEKLPESHEVVLNIAKYLLLNEEEKRLLLEARYGTASIERLYNVPFERNPYFTGRNNLLEHLHDQLITRKPVALRQAISGIGGVGKTQAALEYTYRYRGSYHDILWAGADSLETFTSSYVKLAELLHLREKGLQDQNVIIGAVKRWLSTHEGWLLILDNIEDLSLVSRFVPSGRQGAILLTTQMQVTEPVAQSIEIDCMKESEGALFLLRRAYLLRHDTSLDEALRDHIATARTLSRELGGLPLALDQAGAYIQETGCSLSEYLALYRERHAKLLELRGENPTDHPDSVFTTFSLAFDKVTQKHLAAPELLRFFAFLAPDNIPEELITKGGTYLGSALRSLSADHLEYHNVIKALREFSLIYLHVGKKSLSVHRLVQSVLRDAMPTEVKKQWLEKAIIALNTALTQQQSHWSQSDVYLSHALACAEMIRQDEIVSPEGMILLVITGDCLTSRCRYTEGEELYQQALAVQGRLAQLESFDRALSLQKIGDVCRRQDKYPEAETFIHQSINIYSTLEGLSDSQYRHIIEWCMIAGRLYQEQNKHLEAEALYQLALARQKELSNQFDIMIAWILTPLAQAYLDQDKSLEAETLLRQALTICEQQQKPEQFITATCCATLASACKNLKKPDEAEILLLRAISLMREYYGRDHFEIGIAINDLALLYHEQGNFTKAEPLYYQALAMKERDLGSRHTQVAKTLDGLGMLYYDLHQYEKAVSFISQALDIKEQQLGSSHSEVAISLDNLAKVYMVDRSRYDEVEQLLHRALVIWEQKLGSNHSDTLVCLLRIAELYAKQGRYAEEEPLRQRILAIREQLQGTQPQSIGISLLNLAQCYIEQAKYEQAEPLIQRALSLFEKSPERSHQEVVQGLVLLITIYKEQNKMDDAIHIARQIANDKEKYRMLRNMLKSTNLKDNLQSY